MTGPPAPRPRRCPPRPAAWKELTDKPYDSDALNYRDPFWSNSSGGSRAGVRPHDRRSPATATPSTPARPTAASGSPPTRARTGRRSSTPQTNLSSAPLAVDPADHSVWVGTGEANTAVDDLGGDGIYRSADGGATWQLVGNRLDNSLVFRLTFDGEGHVYAATSQGLLRAVTLDLTAPWKTVLKPDPNPDRLALPHAPGSATSRSGPAPHGQEVVAVLGWRGGTAARHLAYNGFYASHDGGATFVKVTPKGITGPIGRTSLDYAPDGALLAVVEDPTDLTASRASSARPTASPAVRGPPSPTRTSSPHAPGTAAGDPGRRPGTTSTSRSTRRTPSTSTSASRRSSRPATAAAPGRPSARTGTSASPAGASTRRRTPARPTTHPDQHAAYVAPRRHGLLRQRRRRLQPAGEPAQDREVERPQRHPAHAAVLLRGCRRADDRRRRRSTAACRTTAPRCCSPASSKMVSPFGGDGVDVIVDPNNGKRAVNSYVYN